MYGTDSAIISLQNSQPRESTKITLYISRVDMRIGAAGMVFLLFIGVLPTASAIDMSTGRSRMKNTVRSKNIYGVRGGNSLSNARLYGDSTGLRNNYFGSPSSTSSSSKSNNSGDFSERDCYSNSANNSDYRPYHSFGYGNGFTACEAVEYRRFLKAQGSVR